MPRGHPDWQRGPKTTFDFQVASPADPGAGAAIVVTVPATEIWRPILLRYVLQTSGVGAARVPTVRVRDGTGLVMAELHQGKTQAVSTVFTWYWGTLFGVQEVLAGDFDAISSFPEAFLLPGWDLQFSRIFGEAGDLLSVARVLYERITIG